MSRTRQGTDACRERGGYDDTLDIWVIELLCNPDRALVNSHNHKMDDTESGAEETERSTGIQTDCPRQCFANQV